MADRGASRQLTEAGPPLYRQAWLPEGPARGQVVLVHGFGDHGGRLGPLVEPFVAAGLAVHALDLPGHGRSPGPRGHIGNWHEYGDAVLDLLGAIRPTAPQPPRPTFLFGHSLGGVIVLELGLRSGEALASGFGLRGVVVSAPALSPVGARRPLLEALSRPLTRLWPGFSLDLHLDRRALSRLIDDPVVYPDDPLVHRRISARMASETLAALARTRAQAGSWRLPLLVQHGSADRLADPAASQAFVAAARAGGATDVELRIYEGGLHELHHDLEAAASIADHLAWIERHLPATPAMPATPATNASLGRLLGEGGV